MGISAWSMRLSSGVLSSEEATPVWLLKRVWVFAATSSELPPSSTAGSGLDSPARGSAVRGCAAMAIMPATPGHVGKPAVQLGSSQSAPTGPAASQQQNPDESSRWSRCCLVYNSSNSDRTFACGALACWLVLLRVSACLPERMRLG